MTSVPPTVCVDDHEHPKPCTEPEQHESILGLRVLGIGDQERLVIQKDRLCLRERDPVLASVRSRLDVSPLEAQTFHIASITTV